MRTPEEAAVGPVGATSGGRVSVTLLVLSSQAVHTVTYSDHPGIVESTAVLVDGSSVIVVVDSARPVGQRYW